MSFTIKCDKCGNEQVFKQDDKRWQENIEIEVEESHSFLGSEIERIVIYCENLKCNHWIDINY